MGIIVWEYRIVTQAIQNITSHVNIEFRFHI